MSGGIGRKRARSEDGDDGGANENVPIAGAARATGTGTGTIKRQRLAKNPSASVVNQGSASDDAALFPGANIATTPQTPRTVHAVASAITGALAYGVGSLVGANKARSKGDDRLLPRPFTSLLNERNERNARTTQADLDKLYNVVPGGDDEEDNNNNTVKTTLRPAPESDVEENTLVGSASPTPDTPSKKQTPSASAKKITVATPAEKKRKRRDLLEGLAIDGTDKMAAGLEGGSLSRRDRVRGTPKKYLDSEAGNASNGSSASKSRSRSKPANGTALAVVSPAVEAPPAAAVEAFPTPAAAAEGATASTRRRARPTAAAEKETSAADTPTKAPSSSRKREAAKLDKANGDTNKTDRDTNTPASTRRSRAKPTPAKTAEKPAPKRTSRVKSAAKETTTKDAATEQPQQVQEATQAETAAVGGEDSDDDDDVCAICSKPDSEPPNEIVFCETCDLAVHQQCYNVLVIPEGDWFCKNCVRQQKQKEKETIPSGRVDKEADAQRSEAPEVEESAAEAAEKAAVAAARDLAPDIANFEHHLAQMKRVLLGRCTGRHRVRLQGQDEAYDKVHQVVKQTVMAGEGNSMMIIGARGTGKTTVGSPFSVYVVNLKDD